MANVHLNLHDIIDIENFQNMQDNLSKATDMALLTVDYKGVPVTTHSACRAYCTEIRRNPQFHDLCQKCDSRGGLEAARIQKPYIYICHRGIVDLAVPIIADDQYLGAMMAGQIRISDDSMLECILSRKQDSLSVQSHEPLSDYFEALPVLTYEKIEAIGNVLFELCKILVERAMMEKQLESRQNIQESKHASLSKQNKNIKQELMTENPIKLLMKPEIPTQYIFLKPAVEFLHQHVADKVYLEEMSILCNVSESYFSKCFNKAFGMSFTVYQNKLKLLKAEEFLKNTNKNINQISDELGFDHASYFIRLFKKSLGVTPAMYKQLYNEKTQIEYRNQYNV